MNTHFCFDLHEHIEICFVHLTKYFCPNCSKEYFQNHIHFFFLLQSNVIEAAPDMKRESEKEWYFGNADKERRGPYSFVEVKYKR